MTRAYGGWEDILDARARGAAWGKKDTDERKRRDDDKTFLQRGCRRDNALSILFKVGGEKKIYATWAKSASNADFDARVLNGATEEIFTIFAEFCATQKM